MKKVGIVALVLIGVGLIGGFLCHRRLRSEGALNYAPHRYLVSRDFIKANMSDLASVLQTVRAVPKIGADGKFEGFLIQSLESESFFRKFGLAEGDTILQINDSVMSNPGKGLEAFQQSAATNPWIVQIRRKDESIVLNYFVL